MASRELCQALGGPTAGGWSRTLWLTLGMFALGLGAAMAQPFNSGSTGADGALDFSGTPPGTVIEFDPTAFNPALDADGDSIYHFTTITIPANVTVRLRATKAGVAPIHWLATGAVVIDGGLDLNGGDGHSGLGAPEDSVSSRSRGLCWWHRNGRSQPPSAGRLWPRRGVCRWWRGRACDERTPTYRSLY
jgi:hypothetical protein